MSDNNKNNPLPEFNVPEKPKGVLTLTIIMDPAGQVQVEGAIGNEPLAYGMLEVAKNAIRRFHEERNESRIVKPNDLTIPRA